MSHATRRKVILGAGLLLIAAWTLHFHADFLARHAPQWGWLQKSLAWVGPKQAESTDDSGDTDASQDLVPVHASATTRETFHRYIDGYGTIAPRPARTGEMAGGASIAAPAAGVVADVLCQVGQAVHRGDTLIQLDDRMTRAQEDQAAASLAEAQASLASLKATPRPDQLQIARLAVDKSKTAVDFAGKEYDRQKQLAQENDTATKNLEQAALDLASAQNDLKVNEAQLSLLEASPTPQELAVAEAKVHEAEAALAAAHAQRELLHITAPIDASVMQVNVNPGEAVDSTKAIVELVALDRLMVDIDVPAEQMTSLSVGQTALIIPGPTTQPSDSDDNSQAISGKIAFFSPEIDPKTGAVAVGIDLPPQDAIRPGLTVRVRIIAEEHDNSLAVPTESVVSDDDGNTIVCVIGKDDTAAQTKVQTGLREGGLTEITGGDLKDGDAVVTQGAYGLPDGAKVSIAQDQGAAAP